MTSRTWFGAAGVAWLLLLCAAADRLIRMEPAFSCASFCRVLAASCVIALPLAFLPLLLGKWARIVFIALFAWLFLCLGLEWFLTTRFPGLDIYGEGLIAVLLSTNGREIREFLSAQANLKTLLGVAAVILLFAAVVRALVRMRIAPVCRRGLLAYAALLLGCSLALPRALPHDALVPAFSDHAFLKYTSGLPLYGELALAGAPLPKGAFSGAEEGLAVVVIGESSSRAHWSLFGYPRETNPCLRKRAPELLLLSNLTSRASLTPYALRDIFTARDAARGTCCSLPSALDSAGYAVSFISAQGRLGLVDGADELLFATCARTYVSESVPGPFHDDALLAAAEPLFASPTNGPRVLFLHTVGSHVNWECRFPPSFDRFAGETNGVVRGLSPECQTSVNAYDASVLFTDHVLARLIARLEAYPGPALIIYVSDHGESPRTHSRDLEESDLFAIPFLAWASPAWHAAHPGRFARIANGAASLRDPSDLMGVFFSLLGIHPSWNRPAGAQSSVRDIIRLSL